MRTAALLMFEAQAAEADALRFCGECIGDGSGHRSHLPHAQTPPRRGWSNANPMVTFSGGATLDFIARKAVPPELSGGRDPAFRQPSRNDGSSR